MLSVSDIEMGHNCSGFSRRDFLRVGALGGLTLPSMLAAKSKLPSKDVSVVLLFLNGGPPHIEFFDPKMTAPVEFRSVPAR